MSLSLSLPLSFCFKMLNHSGGSSNFLEVHRWKRFQSFDYNIKNCTRTLQWRVCVYTTAILWSYSVLSKAAELLAVIALLNCLIQWNFVDFPSELPLSVSWTLPHLRHGIYTKHMLANRPPCRSGELNELISKLHKLYHPKQSSSNGRHSDTPVGLLPFTAHCTQEK